MTNDEQRIMNNETKGAFGLRHSSSSFLIFLVLLCKHVDAGRVGAAAEIDAGAIARWHALGHFKRRPGNGAVAFDGGLAFAVERGLLFVDGDRGTAAAALDRDPALRRVVRQYADLARAQRGIVLDAI